MDDDKTIDFPVVIPRSDLSVKMPDGGGIPKPSLLRVPEHFRSVEEVLGAASQMNLPNVLVLSEMQDGRLVFLDNDLTLAQANWLLDRMKALLITPNQFERST